VSIFFSVIIPTYDRPKLLESCLDALANQSFDRSRFEVIVVNDRLFPDLTEEDMHRWKKIFSGGFEFLVQEHAGAAAARNKAIRLSKGIFVVMTDDDCLPDNNWLTNLHRCVVEHEAVVGWGGKVLSVRPKTLVQRYIAFKELLREPSRSSDGSIVNIVTANACYRWDALAKVGGFRKDFIAQVVPSGGEDVDLTHRIQRLGTLGYCPDAIVYHHHRDSLKALIRQHIIYGRGAYLACRLNNIPCEGLRFYRPTPLNCARYVFYVLKRIFLVSVPEFRRKKLSFGLYPVYAFLDVVRKLSFLAGTIQYHYFFRNSYEKNNANTPGPA